MRLPRDESIMCNKRPFIKRLKGKNDLYIYDINTNAVFEVDETIFRLAGRPCHIKSARQVSPAPAKTSPGANTMNSFNELEEIKQKGFLSANIPELTYFHSQTSEEFFAEFHNHLQNNLQKLTLVVTEKCNLRCKYCAYSGHYKYHRLHSQKNMEIATMKKAVDFYLNHSQSNEILNISFYGGEPLLNFHLIKECVDYVRRCREGVVNYFLTINGALLNDGIMECLASNNFTVLVSIDGPSVLHDRYRVFKNHKPSFKKIYDNIKRFKQSFPLYYLQKVRFNMVLAPPTNFEAIQNFIDDEAIKPAGIRFSSVNSRFSTFFDSLTREQLAIHKQEQSLMQHRFYEKIVHNEPLSDVEEAMFRKKFFRIHKRETFIIREKYPPHGQCLLGDKSLMVNTDGNFNFCTQITDSFNLGSVHHGFNFEAIKQLYTRLDDFLKTRCHGCWAIRFCLRCIKDVSEGGALSDKAFKQYCRKQRKIIYNELLDYIELRKQNEKCFAYLNNTIII